MTFPLDSSFFQPLATLFVGAVAAILAFWGVQTQRAIARRRATLDFILKSETDRDSIEAKRVFRNLARNGGLDQWAREDNEKTAEAQHIKLVLNEFELVAIGIRQGIIGLRLYSMWFKSGTITAWRYSRPFIDLLRNRTNNNRLYEQFEWLVKLLEKPSFRHRWFG